VTRTRKEGSTTIAHEIKAAVQRMMERCFDAYPGAEWARHELDDPELFRDFMLIRAWRLAELEAAVGLPGHQAA
jgi:hypothetical protein